MQGEKVLNTWLVVNSSTVGMNWVQGRISEWTQSHYKLSIQRLSWRNHVIEMEANVARNYFGATVTVNLLHDGKNYRYLLTQYKYLGGSHGDALPVIETDTHRLHIRIYISGITLCDIPLKKNFVGTIDSFEGLG